MIFRSGKHAIVWRTIKVKGLPHPVTLVRDPDIGGFTSFMQKFPPGIGDGDTVKGSIDSLKLSYKAAKRAIKILKRRKR